MTDQAEFALPDSPSLPRALGGAALDFYYNSWRLVPANAVWGATLLLVVVATAVWLPLVVLAVGLAVPLAGLSRMAVLIARDEPVSFGDFIDGMRRWAVPALAVGTMAIVLGVVFTANVIIGVQSNNMLGWLFSAFALYADIALVMFLVVVWPILVDPQREDLPFARRLRLSAIVGLARPGRIFVLAAIILVIMLVSTALFAALLTVSVAYTSLVTARYVLPAADRLEGRRTKMVVDQGGTS